MGVGQGFPNTTLGPYEIMIPQSFAEFFKWTPEQPEVVMTFDLLQMLISSEGN
jgi:hypothetical protein